MDGVLDEKWKGTYIMMDLHKEMELLTKKCLLFHSEADFQFALAWQIQQSHPAAQIRLEYCPNTFPNMHLDILVQLYDKYYPIELKYKTLGMSAAMSGEYYNIKNHGAQDLGRYDFWNDVRRIESLKSKMHDYGKGFVIMLSNDPTYWNLPKNSNIAICDSFRVHEGIHKSGVLSWQGTPSAGTVRGREEPIPLLGTYQLNWNTYSLISDKRNGKFKHLLLEI